MDRVQVAKRRRVRRGTDSAGSEVREHRLGLEVVHGTISPQRQHLLPPYGGRGRDLNLLPGYTHMRIHAHIHATHRGDRETVVMDWNARP